MAVITCPDCGGTVSDRAPVCIHCGRPMREDVSSTPPAQAYAAHPESRRTPSNGVAAVLSLVIPGAGQMYKEHIGAGVVWLIAVVISYLAFGPFGFLVHLACIYQAASLTSPESRATAEARDAARETEAERALREWMARTPGVDVIGDEWKIRQTDIWGMEVTGSQGHRARFLVEFAPRTTEVRGSYCTEWGR